MRGEVERRTAEYPMLMHSQKVGKCSFLSFRRKPESRKNKGFWTPAFAGVTPLMTFYEAVNVE
jgi:hypothetical protein